MSSLYAEYLKERTGKSLIEFSWGFAVYIISGLELYLSDVFITKNSRSIGNSKILYAELVKAGLKNNCEIMTANIHLKDPNANTTMGVALAYGFKMKECDANVLLISKNLKEENNG